MCLIAEKTKEPKIAETDIDVFKVFGIKKGFMYSIYTGPYQDDFCFGNLNGLYTCQGFDGYTFDNQPDNDYVFKYYFGIAPYANELVENKRKEIEEKTFVFVGFHSFKNFQDALKEVVDLKFDDNFNEKEYDIIHCIIPKGTKYYEGMFDNKECYCSEQIKLNSN